MRIMRRALRRCFRKGRSAHTLADMRVYHARCKSASALPRIITFACIRTRVIPSAPFGARRKFSFPPARFSPESVQAALPFPFAKAHGNTADTRFSAERGRASAWLPQERERPSACRFRPPPRSCFPAGFPRRRPPLRKRADGVRRGQRLRYFLTAHAAYDAQLVQMGLAPRAQRRISPRSRENRPPRSASDGG